MTHPDGASLFGKRVLVELSHAIERFALAAQPGQPLLVIAMFQRLSYFEREAEVYGDIAERAAVTLVGLVEDFPPQLPAGVRHVLLDADDALAREWSVTVLGPAGGATLVASDLETVDVGARTLEEGRRFRGRWSFRRADAYREVLRLRAELTLPAQTVAGIDEVVRTVLATPEPEHQDWWEVPLRYLAGRLDDAVRGRAVVQAQLDTAIDGPERDPRTGLLTTAFLQRWTAGLGAALPVGLVLLRVLGIAELRARYGLKAELAALAGVTRSMQDLLTDVDRVVRLGREDFLVVLPSWEPDRVLGLCDQACARLARLDTKYPFVALPGVAAATVTRERPLPLLRLAEQVARTGPAQNPVSLLAG